MKTYILYMDMPVSLEYANDCLESCNQLGVPAKLFMGVHGKTNRELIRKYGYDIRTVDYSSEYCCTIGHINIWKEIAESGETGVVLEHDAIVMGDYTNLSVKDGEILFLGPRLYTKEDYKFPAGETADYHHIDFYNGTHAYAITANTAAMMLAQLDEIKLLQMPVDGLLGLKNKFNMKLMAVDPAYAIAEIGEKRSFNFNTPSDINRCYFDKFLKCIDKENLPPLEARHFTVDWFTANIPHWVETFNLTNKIFTNPLNVLEIGAFEGMSTCWISDNVLLHPESSIDVIDTFLGSAEHQEMDKNRLLNAYRNNVSLTRNTEKITTFAGDSRYYLPLFISQGKKYDIIYVDGGHMPENVIIDGLCAYHLLKDDGVIIFDDYEWSFEGRQTVKEGVNKLETLIPIKPILTGWQRSYVKG